MEKENKTIRCLIVDDEPAGHKLLGQYIEEIDWLELVGNCYNAMDAMSLIPVVKPDLVLLDNRMPGMTGIEMLKAAPDLDITAIVISADRAVDIEMDDPRIKGYLQKVVFFHRFESMVKQVCDIE